MIHLSSPPQVPNSPPPIELDFLHSANNSIAEGHLINDQSTFAKLLSYEISNNDSEISGQKAENVNAERSNIEESENSSEIPVFSSITDDEQVENKSDWNENSFLSQNSLLSAIQMENPVINEMNSLPNTEEKQLSVTGFIQNDADINEVNGEQAEFFSFLENIAGNKPITGQESPELSQSMENLFINDDVENELHLQEEIQQPGEETALNNRSQTAFTQEGYNFEERLNLKNENFQDAQQRILDGNSIKTSEIQANNKSRSNLEIRDLRTEKQTVQHSQSPVIAAKTDVINALEIEYPLDISSHNAADDADPKSISQSRFENVLARELKGNLSQDIVRNAQIIVRDGQEGTIRLSLKPAFLGDVKIHLEMVENKITGLIVLESNDALRAFERELAALEKAFRDSGFSEAKLSLALAQDGWNFNGREQQEELNPLSFAMAASSYQAEVEEVIVQSDAVLPQKAQRTPINLLV